MIHEMTPPGFLVVALGKVTAHDATYEPCRYKLIIDETEDGGAVRIMQAAKLLPEQWEFLEVSDLPGAAWEHMGVAQKFQALETGCFSTKIPMLQVVLTGLGHDRLRRDLGRFLRPPEPAGRVRFAATVAAGSYSAHQMDDSVVVLEGLLDICQSPKLPLHTLTCAGPEDCASFGYPAGEVSVAEELSDYVIRTTPRAHGNLQVLLQERAIAPVTDCKVEMVSGEEHLLPKAFRAKQRLQNSLPPLVMPICVERWNSEKMEKNNEQLWLVSK
eukprot:Skav236303  [mRNA]  locus=scaffold679:27245:37466:+ [translate_table: standard]